MRWRLFLALRVVSGQRWPVPGLLRSLFFRGHDPPHDRAVQFVGDVHHLSIVGFLADGEGRQIAFFSEILMPSLHRKIALKIALAISSFVATLGPVLGKDSNLI